MLHLLIGRDWTANRDEILHRIAEDVKSRKPGRILLVPELISHDMERRLCAAAGDTASRYAEVLSFTRLARRVTEATGGAAMECLDAGGRVVAMAAAARQLSSRLKAYASVETRPEFLTGLIEGIDEFKRCCLSGEDLKAAARETGGSLAQKLEELSLLMEGYDALCARGKRDPRDQMTWLLEQLEEGTFAQAHTFYIDGFPDYTRQNLAIIGHLIQNAPHVTISVNCDWVDSPLLAFEKAGETASQLLRLARQGGVEAKIEIIAPKDLPLNGVREKLFQGAIVSGAAGAHLQAFHADTPWQECMGAARQIQELVRSGCRYRDISLVCTDMAVYQPLVNLIFHRFHIPVYQSGTEEILTKSVISTVLTALEAAITGFDQRATLRYLRSALSPIDPDTCDLVENYAILWGIRGLKWSTPWEKHPEGLGKDWSEQTHTRLNRLEAARELAIGPLLTLRQKFRQAVSLREQVLALYDFLEDIQLAQRLSAMAQDMDASGDNRSAQILNQLWEILLSALEQLYDVLGDTHWETEHFARLFRLLLSQYDVGTIPSVLDAVPMGPVTAMRCQQAKHLILLGAQEGNLPGYSGSCGVLTDQERVALRELGVPLTGGAMEGIQAEFAEIYGVFCGAMESIRIYCSGDQPSFVFRRLEDLAGGTRQVETPFGFAQADTWEAGAWLAGQNAPEMARSLGVTEAYGAVCRQREYSLGTVKEDNLKALYGKTLKLSASKIDRQAQCRLSYFLEYGLDARERKEATVDPAQFGTYVHHVLECTTRQIRDMGGFHRVSLEETLEIAHQFSQEYAREQFRDIASERMTYLFRRNVQELDMVVEELWQELKAALFEPREFELGFGEDKELPPIAIPNRSIRAVLRGNVDRVDTWFSGGSHYYRVVDYKTGRKDFDYCDVFNGVGLQMLLYLFALKHSGVDLLGEPLAAAGVQYFPARAPYLTAEGRQEGEEAEKARRSQWKRKGLLLRDEAVLRAMDPEETGRSYNVKKDGTITGDLADRDQLRLLESYVFKTLAKLVEDIASGCVDPNPYTRGTSHDACTYCPYKPVCHHTTVEGRRSYKTMTAQRFWEDVEKEMRNHGK